MGSQQQQLFPDTEHLGAAYWANALGSRPAIFHDDNMGIFYLSHLTALYTIGLHDDLLSTRRARVLLQYIYVLPNIFFVLR